MRTIGFNNAFLLKGEICNYIRGGFVLNNVDFRNEKVKLHTFKEYFGL